MIDAHDEAAIRSAAQGWQDAWNRHDMTALHDLFADDADLVTVSGLRWTGRDRIEREHARLHDFQFKGSVWTNLGVDVRALAPGVALAHIRWAMRGDRDADGAPRAPREALFTWVLVQRSGEWRIGAAHNTNVLTPMR
jgi:uncharacterized protein (TIGR02246 family)